MREIGILGFDTSAILGDIERVVGPKGILRGSDTAAYATDWRRLYNGTTPAVLRPATTAELAEIVRICAAARAPLVPQGGNTSMVGGGVRGRTRRTWC